MQNSSATHRRVTSVSGYGLWLVVAIFYALDYMQHTMPGVLILPLSESLHVNFVQIDNILNVYFPIYALCQLPAGYIIDRWGVRKSLSSASVVLSIGLLLMSVPSLWAIFFGRVLIAAGSAFAFVGALKAASMYLPSSFFPISVGVLQALGVFGGLMGQVALNALISLVGWRQSIFLIAMFGFVWALVMLFLLTSRLQSQPKLEKSNVKIFYRSIMTVVGDVNLWLLALFAALMVGAVMSTFAESYAVALLEKIKLVSAQHAAWLSSLIFIGVAVGGPTHGLIAMHFKSKVVWLFTATMFTLIVYTMIVIFMLWGEGANALAILFFMQGFFVSSMLLVFSIAKDLFSSSSQATCFAFINTMIGLGGFFVPYFFGHLLKRYEHASHGGIALLFLIFPLLLALFLVAFLQYRQCQKKIYF